MDQVYIYAIVALLSMSCSHTRQDELLFVEPDPSGGFAYPYFLFIPEHAARQDEVYLIVQPNNSGFIDDDLQKHVESAKATATKDFFLGNYLARALEYPLLVPAFPRPETEWRIYTHDLDRDVMLQKGNSLERIDEQLLHMVADARSRLESRQIPTPSQFLLTGFSASGAFANRFTLLHPEQVFAVAAGGTSGLLMLPLDSLQDELLKYPVGTGDLKALTGRAFQRASFRSTPQLYFLGDLDTNDAIPYEDAFDREEREQIYRLLGEIMQPERWEACKDIYRSAEVNAVIKTYAQVKHNHPEEVKRDVLAFFKACIDKD